MRKSTKKTFQLIKISTIKSLHKWLSLLVFIQLFIWLASGLFFNLMDHSKARGNQYRQALIQGDIDAKRLMDLNVVLTTIKEPIKAVSLIQRLGEPYYLITHQQGLYKHFNSHYSLVDAYTGETTLIAEEMATALAKTSYSGTAAISNVQKVEPPIADFLKEQNTLWKVDFLDEVSTSVYINASSGRLVGHSNEDKRFVDFFFMLHFMDYPFLGEGAVGGFNNGQIIFFALLTLVFSLTGFIWAIELLRKGRYKLSL